MVVQARFAVFFSVLVVSAVVGLKADDCSHNTDNVRGPGYRVEVQSIIDRSRDGALLHEIDYKYSFENRGLVFISDMGVAPPSGTFTYLTSAPCIEFRSAEHGQLLAWVRLKATGVAMGSDSVEIPDQARLSGTSRELVWTPQKTFPLLVRSLSDKYFTFGFELREVGNIHYYISSFRTLDTTNRQLVSQIAIALSQPYGTNGNSLVYHIQFVLRDRPRLSSTFRYGDEVAPETSNAAQKFLSTLTGELNVQGGQK